MEAFWSDAVGSGSREVTNATMVVIATRTATANDQRLSSS
jgi:hypothetical protein